MTFDEIRTKDSDGGYKNSKPYAKRNTKAREEWEAEAARIHQEYRRDIQDAAEDELGHSLTPAQFGAIFNFAWEEGHAYGYTEIVNCAITACEIIRPFLEAKP